MIREPDFPRQPEEQFPNTLKAVDRPANLYQIRKRLLRNGRPYNIGDDLRTIPKVIEGFEDILGEPLGEGLYDNHSGGTSQLVFAIAISQSPSTMEIVRDTGLMTPSAIVQRLREAKVLSGMKIIDLGSGSASFAVAAKALGAKVYTVDAHELMPKRESQLDGHIVINLGSHEAINQIIAETGGEFDLVTENIIGEGRRDVRLIPKDKFKVTIGKIADALLKKGGYLYGDEFGITTSDGPFQKI